MKIQDALHALACAPRGRLKYRGSGFGDALRARLCRAALVEMDGNDMVLTETGRVYVATITKGAKK